MLVFVHVGLQCTRAIAEEYKVSVPPGLHLARTVFQELNLVSLCLGNKNPTTELSYVQVSLLGSSVAYLVTLESILSCSFEVLLLWYSLMYSIRKHVIRDYEHRLQISIHRFTICITLLIY